MNYKLTLAYDGTNYHGWQFQKNAISVEETLLNAMRKLMGTVDCFRDFIHEPHRLSLYFSTVLKYGFHIQ